MCIVRPILRYQGGKFQLGKWIISHFQKHRGYTETLGGAASVLMLKPRSHSEVYNDKWDVVVNVFRVLRDLEKAKELTRLLYLTPFSRTKFSDTTDNDLASVEDPIERARRTILRSFAGFASPSTNPKYATEFRANNNTNGTQCPNEWFNYPGHIKSFVERLQGVVIENKDYREILLQQDTPDTLHFLNPPYVHETRKMERGHEAYEYEFSDQDHIEMANVVRKLSGTVVIAGYDSLLYQDIFSGWHIARHEALGDGASPRIECLYSNRPFPNLLFNT